VVIEVHRELGPGLPEAVYQEALEMEFDARGIPYERQKWVPVVFKGKLLKSKFRIDFLVGGKLIIELKAVDEVHPVHEAQVLAYLKLSGCKLALLVNFNVERAKDGIYRKAMNL
jgi:GxxExxY protein